jgi:hypothetical protein
LAQMLYKIILVGIDVHNQLRKHCNMQEYNAMRCTAVIYKRALFGYSVIISNHYENKCILTHV